MRRGYAAGWVMAGIMSVFLVGCQAEEAVRETETGAETVTEARTEAKTEMETETEPESEESFPALLYQFARMYGIIKSEYPVYELDEGMEWELPEKGKTILLTSAIHQDRELIVSMFMNDYSDRAVLAEERYQNELWKSGDGLFLTGPGIQGEGIKPQESIYATDTAYSEEYGYGRYVIEARFELPVAPDEGDKISGYAIRLLDFEEPLEFALKRVPEYDTLEELAKQEHGSLDTHDNISIISMGERVEEGILVSWYVYSETGRRSISVIYKPPLQEVELPVISGNGKQYPIRQLFANPYGDNLGHYRLSDLKQYGRRTRCLFDVPQEEQNGVFQMEIPGITFLDSKESEPVTLPIPEDYEEVNEDVLWDEGSVRILGITRMKEPQTMELTDNQGNGKVRERPAVYIDVAAVDEEKDLALRGLICQRKLRWSGWENERYDYDQEGNLNGFRIFYEEGDTEVTLKFHGAAFYWNQPYEMELPLLE